ncbi:glutamate receptor ionotropic, delta-2-like [Palaemon carinicauda]|uniref:glutamate receptor ionotropic, delta-2-like n=1 Tax=Palaemon carinicauda TaxID=392227 RepID=UPI0035B5F906
MVMPADGKWGGPVGNGTVVGMIGVVHRREAHFAICEITITGAREGVIDFTYPYYIESLTLVSRTPRERSKTLAAVSPFTSVVWLSIAISVVVTGFIIKAQDWLDLQQGTEKCQRLKTGDSVFGSFRSLMRQDNLIDLKSWSHKVTFLFWSIFSFLISVLYSGMLTAALVIPAFEKPINGLTDLPVAIKDGFTLVVTEDSSNEHIFKYATGGIYKDTWKLFNHVEKSKSFIKKADDSFGGILDNKLVLINGQLSSRYLAMERGIRRYYFARDSFAPQYYGMACFQGAPFTSTFNRLLSYMIEGGLITKWIDGEFQKVAGSNVFWEETGPKPFSISQLQAAFYILSIGIVTAAMAFIAETLLARNLLSKK